MAKGDSSNTGAISGNSSISGGMNNRINPYTPPMRGGGIGNMNSSMGPSIGPSRPPMMNQGVPFPQAPISNINRYPQGVMPNMGNSGINPSAPPMVGQAPPMGTQPVMGPQNPQELINQILAQGPSSTNIQANPYSGDNNPAGPLLSGYSDQNQQVVPPIQQQSGMGYLGGNPNFNEKGNSNSGIGPSNQDDIIKMIMMARQNASSGNIY